MKSDNIINIDQMLEDYADRYDELEKEFKLNSSKEELGDLEDKRDKALHALSEDLSDEVIDAIKNYADAYHKLEDGFRSKKLSEQELGSLEEKRDMAFHNARDMIITELNSKNNNRDFEDNLSNLSDEELNSRIQELWNFVAHQENGMEENDDLINQLDNLLAERKRRNLSNTDVDVMKLKDELNEIKKVRKQLNSSPIENNEIINEVKEKLNDLEKKISTDFDGFNDEINKIEIEISNIENSLKSSLERYALLYEESRKLYEARAKRKSDVLSQDELSKIDIEYEKERKKLKEDIKKVKDKIENCKNQVASLKRKQSKIKRDYFNANALGLSYDEYKEITSTLSNKRIMDAILARKNLSDIVDIPYKERTNEQKRQIKEAKNSITKEIAEQQKKEESTSVLDAIEVLYNLDTKMLLSKKPRNVKVKDNSLDMLRQNSDSLPSRVNKGVVDKKLTKTPLRAPADMDSTQLRWAPGYTEEQILSAIGDGIAEPKGQEYEQWLKETVPLGDTSKPGIPYKEISPSKKDEFNTTRGLVEKYTIFIDNDSGDYFARKNTFNRFNAKEIGNPVTINGALCYRISKADVDRISKNKDNDISPYNIEMKSIENTKKMTPVSDVSSKDNPLKDTIPTNDQKVDRIPSKTTTPIKEQETDKKSSKTDSEKNKPIKPRPNIEHEKMHSRPHVEEIIYKLTKDLDIGKKDAKRYLASNIKVSKNFRDELHSGNYLYNVVHFVPASIKAIGSFFTKLGGKLLTTPDVKNTMETFKARLDQLTEEELSVLFYEYRGSQLKTDMNVQINALIQAKLRDYGIKKVQILNSEIEGNYKKLFTLLKEVDILENKIANSNNSKQVIALKNRRKQLIDFAAQAINIIEKNRVEANNLLSGGIHGLDEDFKAVSTKLSYVGKRFAKIDNFDNKLQAALAKEGKALRDAQDNKDSEAIVDHFVTLEALYSGNTEISNSIFGNRSTGKKYYSPLAEEFDYRDDPFVRDLFTTIAVTSATVSAINAVRVHQIEEDRILQRQNDEANRVNANNDATMDYVHQVGNDISGRRGTFVEGQKAQSYQDFLNGANVSERGAMDQTNWRFGAQYRAIDSANHTFSNNNFDSVNASINDVASRYANGTISSSQALQELANISSASQSTLTQIVNSNLDILKSYAASHPQFDLHGVQEAMQYIANHPTAISDANQAAVDVTNLAQGLTTLSSEHVQALSSLPSDMLTTLLSSAGAVALANKVSSTMSSNMKNGKYGNEVTYMMDEFLSNQEEQEEKEENKHTR